jgi:hypothetical protein
MIMAVPCSTTWKRVLRYSSISSAGTPSQMPKKTASAVL